MAEASTLSPRISFSRDLNLSPSFSYDLHHLDSSLPSTLPSIADDFDFSITLDDVSTPDPSPADELFSHGKILPLSSLKPENIQKPADNPKESNSPIKPTKPSSSSSSSPLSFWSTARSKSLTTVRAGPRSICVFPRSKSTGSDRNQSQSQDQNQSQKQKKSKPRKRRHYYYSGSGKRGNNSYGGGVRINPVISVPAHFSRSGSNVSNGDGGNSGSSVNNLFSYLLCNCRERKELDCGEEI